MLKHVIHSYYAVTLCRKCLILFPVSFFFPTPAKLLPADEQRPVQSAVEDEPRHTGGASIPHLHSFIQVVEEYFSQDFL